MKKEITVPFNKKELQELKAGDSVYINGIIYSARDAAHKRMYDAILDAGMEDEEFDGKKLFEKGVIPFDLTDQVIYYVGPSPEREGQIIGSAGPTTSSRMDKYTPLLLSKGLNGMIGKGKRSKTVIDSIVEKKAVYFAAVGGAGALLSNCIKSSEVIAYDDLGTEAIRRMTVEGFPAIVVVDSEGNNLYETAVSDYLANKN